MTESDRQFFVKLVAPGENREPIACDSVKIQITDGKNGKGAGAYGIRKGHAPAVFALMEGEITASVKGKNVLTVTTGKGFAFVSENTVTVTVDRFSDCKTE